MNWQAVDKSNAVKAVAYDSCAYVLGIQSMNGTPYFYVEVPPEEHERFLRAESKGKAWADIKKKYQARKGDGTLAQQSPIVKPVDPKIETVIKQSAAKAATIQQQPIESIGDSMALTIRTSLMGNLQERLDEFCAPILERGKTFATKALALTVTDKQSFTFAEEAGKVIADERRSITELLKPTKRAIDSVKDVVLDKEKELLGTLAPAEDHLKRICTDYRVAEQRRANEAAEAERKQKLREAEDARIRQAETAQAAGKDKLADALLSTPVTAPKVEVKPEVPKVAGVSSRVHYRWRLKDINQVPREWLVLNETLIGKFARDRKLPDGSVHNGIEFYQEPDTNF